MVAVMHVLIILCDDVSLVWSSIHRINRSNLKCSATWNFRVQVGLWPFVPSYATDICHKPYQELHIFSRCSRNIWHMSRLKYSTVSTPFCWWVFLQIQRGKNWQNKSWCIQNSVECTQIFPSEKLRSQITANLRDDPNPVVLKQPLLAKVAAIMGMLLQSLRCLLLWAMITSVQAVAIPQSQ